MTASLDTFACVICVSMAVILTPTVLQVKLVVIIDAMIHVWEGLAVQMPNAVSSIKERFARVHQD